jgi:hypothetical protein
MGDDMTWKWIDSSKIKYRRMTSGQKMNRFISLCIVLMSIVLVCSFFLKIRLISRNMPYSCHYDEKYVAEPALSILKTGDFNPHSFRYPSLPIYLAAASFTMGYLNSAANAELKNTKDLEPKVYPYFKHPGIIWHAKVVFTLLSALAMICMALIAYRFYKNPFFLFGVPLIASLSYYYFYVSAYYLNVDTVATFFIFLVYLHHSFTIDRDSILHKVVIPGILSGLVIACKYNLVWIIAPSILVILFNTKKKRTAKILSVFLIMLLTFVLIVPFSILDFSTFLDWLAFDITAYKNESFIYASTPGLPLLIYYLGYFLEDFGLLCLLALFGIIAGFFYDWKKTIILLSFPLLLLFHLASYALHFPRNIMSLFGFFAIFAALGTVYIYKLLCRLFFKLSRPQWPRGVKKAVVFLFLTIILFFPVKDAFNKQLEKLPDSRPRAINWITGNVGKEHTLIISQELGLYLESLKKKYKIVEWEFGKLDPESFYEKIAVIENPVVVMPLFRPHREHQLIARKKADALNAIAESLKKMKVFGENKAIIKYSVYPIDPNPKIIIGTL